MITNTTLERSNALVDQAAASADHAIKSTQRVANGALDSLAGSVQDLRSQATPLLNHTGDQIGALAQRGVDAVRDSSQYLREGAVRASDTTVGYIRDEPVKAVLIAGAVGAALMALFSLLTRSHRS